MLFEITKVPIDTHALESVPPPTSAGGVVLFEGRVRDHHHGRQVTALDYEVYEELALTEAEKIIQEAKEQFSIVDVHVVHRMGHLEVGELALWLRVAAPHRASAFHACQYIIDQLKTRLPIWKKEHYLDGDATWVACKNCSQHRNVPLNEKDYYHRQQQLKKIGTGGQEKLKQARVLVVGAGGLGCPALTYLTLAGIGHVGICDGDTVEVSNLHRQTLYSYNDIGTKKVELAKQQLSKLNPFVNITNYTHHLELSNVQEILSNYDLVLDCTDTIQTKYLLHDACHFREIPLIQAAIYQFEGQLQTFLPGTTSGCMRCLMPHPPQSGSYQNCEDAGVIGYVPGIVGSFQAMEAIKILLEEKDALDRELLLVNLNNYALTRLERLRNRDCPLCGENPSITKITSKNYSEPAPVEWEINLRNSHEQVLSEYHLIDIRAIEERDHRNVCERAMEHIPMEQRNRFHTLPKDKQYLLVCQCGGRSYQLVQELRASGFHHFYSLEGGVSKLRELIK